jgi:hypothetical protein
MTSTTEHGHVLDSLDNDLAAALGPEIAALWRTPRGPTLSEIRVEHAGGSLVAAVLTTRRPSTAATKIAHTWRAMDLPGSEAALARLVEQVIDDARHRGEVAVKWQSVDGELAPLQAGFAAMRLPYRSAAGTEDVAGYIYWLYPVAHTESPYYAQTSTFTCGAVTALLASEIRGSGGFEVTQNTRDQELEFWRQASNFPACEPIGLAVALRASFDDAAGSAPVEVFLDTEGPALLEAYPSGFDRTFREELQASSLRQALDSDIAVNREHLPIHVLTERIQAGELALLLINTQQMYGFSAPHWVLAHSVEQGVVVIDDPSISSSWGETWVDAHELPISIAELDRMIAWGEDGYRGVVFVRRA